MGYFWVKIMSNDKLSEVFDVEPITVDENRTQIISPNGDIIPPKDNILDADYDHSRANLYTLIDKGKLALEHAISVAQQSEQPRAFEVVSTLIKDLADVNNKLIDLHKKKQAIEAAKIQPSAPENDPKNITNNAIFVGSTSELSKMLENMRKGK